MTYDLLLNNCSVVRPEGIIECDILINRGKIVGLMREGGNHDAKEVVDIKSNYVLPGLIDTHVHLGKHSSQGFGEDCRSESRAAVTGGVTTFFYYLMEKESYSNLIEERVRDLENNSLVDMAFHAIIMNEAHIKDIPRCVNDFGITSFKFFMTYRGAETGVIQGVDDGQLYEGFQRVAELGGCLALVHAENIEIIQNLRGKFENSGRQDVAAWSDSRPKICEEEGINRAIFLAERANTPLCIAHLSVGRAVGIIANAKSLGSRVFAETCPHYLLLTKNIRPRKNVIGKVNPPLREQEDIDELWRAIRKGIIDFMGSDHTPWTLASKGDDLWTAKPGMPGITMTLPVLLSEGVNKGRIRIEDIPRICSYNPARILGIFPQKGAIDIGADADIVIVDINKKVKVSADILHSNSDYTPYEGYSAKGWPIMTIAGGEIVYADGKVIDRDRRARYLFRKIG